MTLGKNGCFMFLTEVRMFRMRLAIAVTAMGLLVCLSSAPAANRWLPTSGTNDWYENAANWSEGTFPAAGEDVVITNAGVGVLLTNAAPASGWLNSFVISNTATLIFTNWDTTLSATTVNIMTNGRITCSGPFTNNVMSNRVYVVCSNMVISTGGRIDVNARGYSGGTNDPNIVSPGPGQGPGGGLGKCGGGYGGVGGIGVGNASGGITYDSPDAPVAPGSGGGGGIQGVSGHVSAHGGGAVRIQATGTVTVNGTITANGGIGDDNHGGGGSGGGIYISCAAFAGTNGVVMADGGLRSYTGGGGGGGRIAVNYIPSAQSNLPLPSVYFSALPGAGSTPLGYGDLGTLWFTSTLLLTNTIGTNAICNGQVIIPGFTGWSPQTLTISNGWVRFPAEGFQLTVSNDVIVTGSSGKLELGGNRGTNTAVRYHPYNATNGPTMQVLGNLILTNGGSMAVYSGITPQGGSPATSNGALVAISGTMVFGSNCWVYPYSHPTNGGSVLFTMRDLTISATNSGFNADSKGYLGGTNTAAAVAGGAGYGPGYGLGLCGGGYGGVGGRTPGAGGTYGSSNAPVDPGSGGGGAMQNGPPSTPPAGQGGGAVRIQATGTVMLNGIITANGGDGASNHGGGGSGGGVYVYCRTFAGNNATVRVNGGNGSETGGGGGGGRIAIWRVSGRDLSSGISNSATGGTASYPGTNGTIVLGWLPPAGTVITVY